MAAPASAAPGRSSRPRREPAECREPGERRASPEPVPAGSVPRGQCPRGQRPGAERQRGQPDGHVHQEDHPPAAAEHVGADQAAGSDRPEHRGQAHHRPVDAERLAHLVRREQVPDQAEHLRQHDRPEQALDSTGGDELTRALRRGARGRREHEPGHPGQQHPPPPEDVTQPPAGQQPHRHGQGVGGGDPLDDGVRAAQLAPDRRGGDLGDSRVEQVHHRRRDHRAERHPPPASHAPHRPPGPADARPRRPRSR